MKASMNLARNCFSGGNSFVVTSPPPSFILHFISTLLLLFFTVVLVKGTRDRTTMMLQEAPVKLIMLWNPVNCINTPGRSRNAQGQGRTVPRAPHGPTTQM